MEGSNNGWGQFVNIEEDGKDAVEGIRFEVAMTQTEEKQEDSHNLPCQDEVVIAEALVQLHPKARNDPKLAAALQEQYFRADESKRKVVVRNAIARARTTNQPWLAETLFKTL